jgi:hypothetical protein
MESWDRSRYFGAVPSFATVSRDYIDKNHVRMGRPRRRPHERSILPDHRHTAIDSVITSLLSFFCLHNLGLPQNLVITPIPIANLTPSASPRNSDLLNLSLKHRVVLLSS